jgi:hypothetical protein
MMTKAENLGLRFFPDPRRQAREGANFRDRLLDSRDGIAAYYRYGPRNLPKLCAEKIPEGMIAIHRTAFEKIKAISDAYAPDGLPANFTVVDSEGLVRKAGVSAGNSIEWTSLQNSMDKLVAARAMLYRVFVELTMAILVLSGLLWRSAPESIVQLKTASGGGILQAIAELLSYLTPVYFENFIYAVVWKFPLIFPLMLLTLFAIERLRNRYVNALEQVCLRMCALVAYQDESANAPARPSRRRKA